MKLNSKKELTPVVYGETAVKILSFSFDKNKEIFAQHWHDRIELHIVKSGTLILNCNGEEVIVNPGEVSIISPTFTHSGNSGIGGVEYYVIMFQIEDLYNDSLPYKRYMEYVSNGDIYFQFKTDIPQIVVLANEIVEMNIKRDEYHTLEIVGSLYRLLGLLCQHCKIDNNHSLQPPVDEFDNVINYINANFNKKITVDTVSRKFNYEKSYFCRKFKNTTGINATKYIRILRLEHALYLLENTDKSITDISISCGFSDSAYFINCFKNMYNTTPLKYRNTKLQTSN